MVERLYWHIGQPKTGTTYLQKILWANEERLAAQGIALPGIKHRWLLWAALDLAEMPNLELRDPRAPGSWDWLVEEIRSTTAPTAVVSHEFFCAATAEQVEKALVTLDGIEVHVVITARDAAGMLAAGWQENVKNGGTETLPELFAESAPGTEFGWWVWDLAQVLERWSTALPSSHVHVLPVPRAGGAPDQHWSNFAEVIGYTGEVDLPEREVNSSLGVVQIEALRQINKFIPPMRAANRGDWIRGYLAETKLSAQSSPRVRLNAKMWEDCRRRSQGAVDLIAERGIDVVGDVTRLLVPDQQSPGRLAGRVTHAERAKSLAKLSGRMVHDLRQAEAEMIRMRRENEDLLARLTELDGTPYRRARRLVGKVLRRESSPGAVPIAADDEVGPRSLPVSSDDG